MTRYRLSMEVKNSVFPLSIFSHFNKKLRIFSEIDGPLDFNENMSTNEVLYVIS